MSDPEQNSKSYLSNPTVKLIVQVVAVIIIGALILAFLPANVRNSFRDGLSLVATLTAISLIIVSLIMMAKSKLRGESVVDGLQWYIGVASGGILLSRSWMFFAILIAVFLLVFLFEKRIVSDSANVASSPTEKTNKKNSEAGGNDEEK